MYKIFILSFFIGIVTVANAQVPANIDTIKEYTYKGLLRFGMNGTDTACTLDGKPIADSLYRKIEKANCKLWGKCRKKDEHLFFVNTFDLKERLLYSAYRISSKPVFFGPYKEFYPNGQLKVEGAYQIYGTNWARYEEMKYQNIKTGEWKYYKKNGKVEKTEVYKNGVLTETKE